jgi:hypothetical protein
MKALCSVHDSCAEVWADPFTSVNTGSAIRSFSDAVNNDGNDLNAHPEHFNLYQIGSWNPDDGFAEFFTEPKILVRAIDVKMASDQLPMFEGQK